jgi:hypothetical protein
LEDECENVDVDTNIVDDFTLPSPPTIPSVEEDEEGDSTYLTTSTDRFIESYPGDAGQGMRKTKTRFEELLIMQEAEGKKPWEPFASEEEWDLTKWLIKNVGQRSTDEYLKLPIVSEIYVPFLLFKTLTVSY